MAWHWRFRPRAGAGLSLSARTWIGLSVLAPLGMLIVSTLMLLDLRRDAWQRVAQTSHTMLQMIERDIARNVDLYSLSLQAVLDGLKQPLVMNADPALRQMVLFDRAAAAKDVGALLVINEHGDIVIDSQALPPRTVNYADRSYFQAHKANPNLGLHISGPLTSRLMGVPILALTRRVEKPDGSFGGIVLVTWKLSSFQRLFERFSLGHNGAVLLFHADGTRIMRQPYAARDVGASMAGSANFERFRRADAGSFVGHSNRDGLERYYAFTRIGDWPLILAVATATGAIASEWWAKATVITAIVLALGGLTISLALLLGRALHRRTVAEEAAQQANAELAKLAVTDGLTGLANRRHFDEAFAREWQHACRSKTPLSLLIVDADHFKQVNDRYGHPVGDEVLRGLAGCLNASMREATDRAYRLGGEEFAILLPGTDQDGALRVADRVHAAVAGLGSAPAGLAPGAVTVSIGLACLDPAAPLPLGQTQFFQAADGALYDAKIGGRNQTQVVCLGPTRRTVLSVVAAAS